jgi:hypothetical protein
MAQTFEAIIDQDGNIHLLESIHLPTARRALVTILEEEPAKVMSETSFLSEQTLAEDWLKPEEEKAWSHLPSVG